MAQAAINPSTQSGQKAIVAHEALFLTSDKGGGEKLTPLEYRRAVKALRQEDFQQRLYSGKKFSVKGKRRR